MVEGCHLACSNLVGPVCYFQSISRICMSKNRQNIENFCVLHLLYDQLNSAKSVLYRLKLFNMSCCYKHFCILNHLKPSCVKGEGGNDITFVHGFCWLKIQKGYRGSTLFLPENSCVEMAQSLEVTQYLKDGVM